VGLGEFYTTDGHGKVRQLGRSDSEWRDSWTQIVAGNFGATTPKDYTDLLFYDKSKKELQFYKTDGKGNIKQLGTIIQLPLPGSELMPSQIVAGNFGATPFTDLLFYDDAKGRAEFYTTDGQGNLKRLGDTILVPLKQSQIVAGIVAGNFGPTPRDGDTPPKDFTDLLFYKRP
jgi:hypothetical protein